MIILLLMEANIISETDELKRDTRPTTTTIKQMRLAGTKKTDYKRYTYQTDER
jgi:hypothetical protein